MAGHDVVCNSYYLVVSSALPTSLERTILAALGRLPGDYLVIVYHRSVYKKIQRTHGPSSSERASFDDAMGPGTLGSLNPAYVHVMRKGTE